MGIKEARRRFNDGGSLVVSLDLEDVALGVGDDGYELKENVLGLHVEGKGVGERLGLSRVHLEVVLHRRQVAEDALVGRRIKRQLLGRRQQAANEGDLDGTIVAVGNLNEGLGRAAVDELHAEDVGIGEGRRDIGGERSRGVDRRGTGTRLSSVLRGEVERQQLDKQRRAPEIYGHGYKAMDRWMDGRGKWVVPVRRRQRRG